MANNEIDKKNPYLILGKYFTVLYLADEPVNI